MKFIIHATTAEQFQIVQSIYVTFTKELQDRIQLGQFFTLESGKSNIVFTISNDRHQGDTVLIIPQNDYLRLKYQNDSIIFECLCPKTKNFYTIVYKERFTLNFEFKKNSKKVICKESALVTGPISLKDDSSNLYQFELAIANKGSNAFQAWIDFQLASSKGFDYKHLSTWEILLKAYGITFEYGLDAEPHSFKITS